MKRITLISLAFASVIAMPVFGADKLDIGKVEYDQSCATCHGLDGKGKGSFSQAFELSMPDTAVRLKIEEKQLVVGVGLIFE